MMRISRPRLPQAIACGSFVNRCCCILNASQNQLRVEEGSLYPALRRMEADGLIRAEWRASENNRRARYYHITKAGKKRLASVVERWHRHAAALSTFLDFA